MSATETAAVASELIEQRSATLAGALVAALADLTLIGKGRTANAGSYSYTYADLGDVVAETRPVLAQHGLVALTPVSGHPDGRLQVTPILLHRSGEQMAFEPFPFTSPNDPRATGSNVTYFRRYALLAALGIATGEDDDGEAGSKAAAAPRPLTINQAKNYLVSLIGKDEAVQAWEWWRVLSDDPPEFPAEVDALAKRWQERPMDEEATA